MARPVAIAVAGAASLLCVVAPGVITAAGGQAASSGKAMITPSGDVDPGTTIKVSNASNTPRDICTSAHSRTISVDILTSTERLVGGPYTATVGAVDGTWTVPVPLAPDLAPGAYKALSTCYEDGNSAPVRSYDPALFNIRQQNPGTPNVQPAQGAPGDSVQIGSGPNKCTPPNGASAAKARASLLDSAGNSRAAGEGPVYPDGSWSVTVRVPDVPPQGGTATAACLADTAASAPYAVYGQSRFAFVAAPVASTSSTTPATSLAPGQVAPPTTHPAAPTTAGPTPRLPGFTAPLPDSPVAQPIIADPTYTG